MVFVNTGLGNAFRIKDIDSPKDNEHYFSGNKKHIKLIWYFLSGNASTGATSLEQNFTLASSSAGGPGSLDLSASLHDSNNYIIVRGDARAGFALEPSWFQPAFGIAASGSDMIQMISPILSCEISASTTVFNVDDIDIVVRSGSSDLWESLKPLGTFDSKGDDNQFFTFNSNYNAVISATSFSSSFVFQNPLLLLTCSNGTYVFKNIKLEYFAALTNNGVNFFRDLDNQNHEFRYVNTNTLKAIE